MTIRGRIGGLVAVLILLAIGMPVSAQHRGVTIEPVRAAPEALGLGDAYALVIGNNQYRHLPVLQTAVSDAAAVAELLRSKYDFTGVELLVNASRADILSALNRYRNQLEPEDRLLIYYAGHGLLDRQAEEGYWLPVEAEADDNVNWISNASITAALKAMLARQVMIVADSCYSGALTRDAGADLQPEPHTDRLAWLTRVAAKRARTALVSGGLEPVLDGGRNGHSVFATAFLDVLRENDGLLDGQRLFDLLKGRVVVNAEQTPAYGNVRFAYHEGGDFIFAPRQGRARTNASAAPSQRTIAAAPDPCMQVWQGIASSRLKADLQAFLATYPDCLMAPIARARLQTIEDEERLAVRAPPAQPQIAVDDRDETLVAVKNANVRARPDVSGQKLATLPRGRTVSVTGKVRSRDWLRIAMPDGNVGYVWAKLLADPASATENKTAAKSPAPATRAGRPFTISNGERGQKGGWAIIIKGRGEYVETATELQIVFHNLEISPNSAYDCKEHIVEFGAAFAKTVNKKGSWNKFHETTKNVNEKFSDCGKIKSYSNATFILDKKDLVLGERYWIVFFTISEGDDGRRGWVYAHDRAIEISG